MFKKIFISLFILFCIYTQSQVLITKESTATAPNTNIVLELKASDKGLLIPRLALTSLASASPLSAHVAGMVIYNTTDNTELDPGFHYNDGSSWVVPGNTVTDLMSLGSGNHVTIDAGVGSDGTSLGTGSNNIAIGEDAGSSLTTNSRSILIGNNTGSSYTTGGNDIIAVGSDAASSSTASLLQVAIGTRTLRDRTATSGLGVVVGHDALPSMVTGGNQISVFGARAGFNATASLELANIEFNTLAGYQVASNIRAIPRGSTIVGRDAFQPRTAQWNNTSINNLRNTVIGTQAMGNINANSTVGAEESVVVGYKAFEQGVTDRNTAIGAYAAQTNTMGSDNTTIGWQSGMNYQGDHGIIFGQTTNITDNPDGVVLIDTDNITNLDNALIYGSSGNDNGGSNNTLSLGGADGQVGIANRSPTSTLDVNGSISAPIRTLSTGTVSDQDYTVIVTGDINLPNPSSDNAGRKYNLVNGNTSANTIGTASGSNVFATAGSSNASSFDLGTTDGSRAITVQSTGSNWRIISRN